jgi:RalA-binding protein 1
MEMDKAMKVQALSYDDTVAAEAPVRGPAHRDAKDPHGHSPKAGSFSSEGSRNYPSISGPTNGAPIQNLENWGNKPAAAPTTVKDKKRSIFGFGSRPRGPDPLPDASMNQHRASDRVIQQNRNVFGIPLAEAVDYTQPIGLSDPIPSVVFRSLEYLRAKNAINEEGIFRLSGSNIVIRALRERFNTEGDVKLLDGQYYDIHAVASLLKLFLRELPASILTRELHLDFIKVLGM